MSTNTHLGEVEGGTGNPGGSSPPLPEDASWDQRILALIDAGIDPTLIAENLRRTPTERLRRMQDMLRFIEAARGDGRPAAA